MSWQAKNDEWHCLELSREFIFDIVVRAKLHHRPVDCDCDRLLKECEFSRSLHLWYGEWRNLFDQSSRFEWPLIPDFASECQRSRSRMTVVFYLAVNLLKFQVSWINLGAHSSIKAYQKVPHNLRRWPYEAVCRFDPLDARFCQRNWQTCPPFVPAFLEKTAPDFIMAMHSELLSGRSSWRMMTSRAAWMRRRAWTVVVT